MRVAIVSDIHANLAAFEAVLHDLESQCPDIVYVAGDFLNRGPQPREVWELLQSLDWPMLRGNHEDYVIAQCQTLASDDPLANPIWQPARWTAEQIGREPSGFAHLPIAVRLKLADAGEVVIAHASERRNNEGLFKSTSDEQLRLLLGSDPAPLFCCGHTHVALIREFGSTLAVNAGAVGMPFNGDTRAQYAVATWREGKWHADLRAVPYDLQRTVAAFTSHGFLGGGGPLARVILHELLTAGPHLSNWVRTYAEAVHARELSVGHAVDLYLANPPAPAH